MIPKADKNVIVEDLAENDEDEEMIIDRFLLNH